MQKRLKLGNMHNKRGTCQCFTYPGKSSQTARSNPDISLSCSSAFRTESSWSLPDFCHRSPATTRSSRPPCTDGSLWATSSSASCTGCNDPPDAFPSLPGPCGRVPVPGRRLRPTPPSSIANTATRRSTGRYPPAAGSPCTWSPSESRNSAPHWSTSRTRSDRCTVHTRTGTSSFAADAPTDCPSSTGRRCSRCLAGRRAVWGSGPTSPPPRGSWSSLPGSAGRSVPASRPCCRSQRTTAPSSVPRAHSPE